MYIKSGLILGLTATLVLISIFLWQVVAAGREGGNVMTTPVDLIDLAEVDSKERSTQQEEVQIGAAPPPYANGNGGIVQAPKAYVPTYLPAGFALTKSQYYNDQRLYSVYASNDFEIFLMQNEGVGRPRVKRGHVERRTMFGQPAFVVRGMWLTITKDGITSPEEWDPDVAIQIYFQHDGYLFMLTALGYPTDFGVTEADIVRMAESIEVYE